jgi:hypothetical protein
MSVNGSYPALQEYNGIQYLVTYTSGVGQIIRRSQNDFSTLLPYGAVTATSALVCSSTNADRAAFLKTDSAGRVLICGVPYGDNILVRRSLDDGETWSTVV